MDMVSTVMEENLLGAGFAFSEDCEECSGVACFQAVLGAVEEYFLDRFGLYVEIVMPFGCMGGAVRAFEDFDRCSASYNRMITVMTFDTLGEFAYNAVTQLRKTDPFGVIELGLG